MSEAITDQYGSVLPLITVITVVYNGAEFLERTLQSVLGQKYANLQYIVIDGGSSDGTKEILKCYADRLTFWLSEPDRGIYDAMNKGWSLAQENSFIIFIGSGDRLLSLPLDMHRYSADEVLCGRVFTGDSCVFQPRAGFYLKLYNSLHHQALLVHKSLHPAPPFDLNYPTYADFDFNQRLYRQGVKFIYKNEFTAYALPGGVSKVTRLSELRAVINKNFGPAWSLLSYAGFSLAAIFPVLRKFRPVVNT